VMVRQCFRIGLHCGIPTADPKCHLVQEPSSSRYHWPVMLSLTSTRMV
jgi:hypothetical protein